MSTKHPSPAAGAVLAAGVLVHAAPAAAPHVAFLRRWHGIDDRLVRRDAVALTFDDGPHAQGTPAVLDALALADGAVATFFLVGEQVLRHPALAREIVAAGHGVALHCHRHRNQLRLGVRALREDLRRGAGAIEDATGRSPAAHRAPYGAYSAAGLTLARRAGRRPVLWTRWGRDWRAGATPANIAEEVAADLHGGEILLLHDADHYAASGSWKATAAAVPRVLDRVGQAGLRPTGLDTP